MRDSGAEPQSLVHVPKNTWVKSLRSPNDVKAYILLIAIRLLNGNVKPGGPLDAFQKKSRLMPVPDFPSTHPHLIFNTYILQHTTKLVCIILGSNRDYIIYLFIE